MIIFVYLFAGVLFGGLGYALWCWIKENPVRAILGIVLATVCLVALFRYGPGIVKAGQNELRQQLEQMEETRE